ncbi:MAG: NAD(P)-dependent glycerol-3-phosphate dehydrogenase, partial [Proteobacteria bacterium]|nr:NAD(P)-dependent glycerol-3-phosphate dehydrogenase [Pseudomonadota bacterium]
MTIERIGVVGGGAWGTALGHLVAKAGRQSLLWARDPKIVASINQNHENPAYLKDIPLAPDLKASADLAEICRSDAILLVVPAQAVRTTLETMAAIDTAPAPVICCAKGLEIGSGLMMSEVAAQSLATHPFGCLSGPTFAAEAIRGVPTAATLAIADTALGAEIARAIGSPTFRPYVSSDVIGAEIGGAVKNVLAIGCGIVEGRGYGDNARAALITRGLAEMARLCAAKGGRPETLMGLSGIGDLTLTCNAMQSRNFSLGCALGQGRSLADVLGARRSVAEGVDTAAAVMALTKDCAIHLQISAAVDAIVNRGA